MTTSEWRDASLARQIGELAGAFFPEFTSTAPSQPQAPVGAVSSPVEAATPPAGRVGTPSVADVYSQALLGAGAPLGGTSTPVESYIAPAASPSVPGTPGPGLTPAVDSYTVPGWSGPGDPFAVDPLADQSVAAATAPAASAPVSPRLLQVDQPDPGPAGQPSSAGTGGGRHRLAHVGTRSVDSIRADFPILSEVVSGKPLVWFDNGATTQRPRAVIDRLVHYYEHENSNVHRAAHELAARSTDAYEGARQRVADFIGAGSPDDIVFVRGTTEGVNLIARSFVKPRLSPGDEIVLTILEHHANIVPWQIIAAETGAVIKVAPVDASGQILVGEYAKLFTPRTRFASFAHVSNALGTITPAAELIAIAHSHGVPVLLDAAQSVSHIPLDVQALDADFLVFSGHKIYGPTGVGAVYGKKELLDAAAPYQGGGNMIADVTFEKTVYQKAPAKFEAGTGTIADAVGLGAALDYVSSVGIENIEAYEHLLLTYGTQVLEAIPGVHIIGNATRKASILSFVVDGHPVEDVGQALSREGIAVRAGHHCAQPVLRHFGLEATVRASLAFYNTCDELDSLGAVLSRLVGHPKVS